MREKDSGPETVGSSPKTLQSVQIIDPTSQDKVFSDVFIFRTFFFETPFK